MSINGISFDEINAFLTQSVAIQAQSTVSDNAGGDTVSFATASTVNGLVSSLNGREMYEMEKINPLINSKVYLIKGSVVTNENRLLINSKHYDVEYVKNPVSADEFIIAYTVSNEK